MMTPMHPLRWLRERDGDLVALRRSTRTAIVMPALFAVGDKVIGNPTLALFAAFGSIAMLLLVDFGGTMRERLLAELGLAVVGAVFIPVATLASRAAWLAALAMTGAAFLVLYAGVVSSVLAGATTSLLLSFILPVAVKAPASAIPDRLAGWGIASGAALLAIAFLWPAPVRDPLRGRAANACRALAAKLRSDVAYMQGGQGAPTQQDHDRAVAAARDAIASLQTGFLATPYRPSALSMARRTVIRMVDELNWLTTVIDAGPPPEGLSSAESTFEVKAAAAAVLEQGAAVLDATAASTTELDAAFRELKAAVTRMQRHAIAWAPVKDAVTALEPTFRAQEVSFAVSLIGRNARLTAEAEQRSQLDRLLGRHPEGVVSALAIAHRRAAAYVGRNSVWLHNSVRGAVGLGLAVLVANLSGVQHSFWIVLGTLSVLRSNALSTGQNVLRGLLGTIVGFVIGAVLLAIIGTNHTVLWVLLPVAILLAGVTPAVISFAAGQAAFTLTLVILFNIIQPAGWKVGLIRVEDVAIGCAVSLIVGLLFWPRGAGAALARALADAYADSVRYLSDAVGFGVARGSQLPEIRERDEGQATAAAWRLDDTFRNYLAEKGPKPLPLPDVTRLVTAVSGLRLAGDAVLDLWRNDDGEALADAETACHELLHGRDRLTGWYDDLAQSLQTGTPVRDPVPADHEGAARLLDAVHRDLGAHEEKVRAAAVRMVWTADHIDAARSLQAVVVDPARAAAKLRALGFVGRWTARARREPPQEPAVEPA
jgi:uncharacterized membrane protein YccC